MLRQLHLPAPRIADIMAGMDVPEFAPGEATGEFARIYERGLKAYEARQFKEALRSFKELLRRRPGSPRALLGSAWCHVGLQDPVAAAGAAFTLLEAGARYDALLQGFVRPLLHQLMAAVEAPTRGPEALALLRAWTGMDLGTSSAAWLSWWRENQWSLRFDLGEQRFVRTETD
jgi:hypothetical protein